MTADVRAASAGPRCRPRGRTDPYLPATDSDRLTLFATYARGPLPREIILANERRKYPFAHTDVWLTSCADDDVDAGAPCACTEMPASERCNVPTTETRLRHGHCSGRFDDAKRQIEDVRKICEPEGAKCNWSSILCCGGLRCEPGAGICKKKDDDARPSDAAAAAPSDMRERR